jgi:hypothetical protein
VKEFHRWNHAAFSVDFELAKRKIVLNQLSEPLKGRSTQQKLGTAETISFLLGLKKQVTMHTRDANK